MKKDNGVSVVIGVILMIEITVAICATMWTYIDILIDETEHYDITEGNITEKFRMGNNWMVTYYFVINDDFDVEVTEYEYYHTEVGEIWFIHS